MQGVLRAVAHLLHRCPIIQMQKLHDDMQGVLPAVAKLLHSHHSEVHVRALLALGMLVGSSQDNQTKLANIDGALSTLLVLRLQQDDEDSKHIADGIVAAMVNFLTFAGNSTLVCRQIAPVLRGHDNAVYTHARILLHSLLHFQLLLKQACRQLLNKAGLIRLLAISLSAMLNICDHLAAGYGLTLCCLLLLCPAVEEPKLQATAHSCIQSAI